PKGRPKPDISTPAAVKKALMAAKSIGYEDPDFTVAGQGPWEALTKLGIADQVATKSQVELGPGAQGISPTTTNNAIKTSKRLEKRLDSISKLLQQGMRMLAKTDTTLAELAVAQKRTDVKLAELATAQKETERSLKAFIKSLRHGRNGRNDRRHPQLKLAYPLRRTIYGADHHEVGSGLRTRKNDTAAAHSRPDAGSDGGDIRCQRSFSSPGAGERICWQ